MQYFVRELYTDDDDAATLADNYDAAAKAYAERLAEVKDDLPKPIRKLLDDKVWSGPSNLRFVNDHFYIEPCEELTFLLEAEGYMFVVRYTVDAMPQVDAPNEADKAYFDAAEKLEIIEEEWDLDAGKPVHRVLLNNGFIVTFRPKDFHWWKAKVEAGSTVKGNG